MPETNETNNPDKSQYDTPKPSLSSPEENTIDSEGGTKKTNEKGQENNQNILNCRPNIVVNIPKDENPLDSEMLIETKRANRTNRIALFFNGAFLLATLVTLVFVKASTDAAVAAVGEARRSTDHAIKKDSLDYIRDTANERKQNEKYDLNTQLTLQSIRTQEFSMNAQSNSAQTAIEAYKLQMQNLELYKKSLETEYQSDLRIKSAYLTKAAVGQPIEGVCQFITVGKVPVKADSSFTYVYFTLKTTFPNIYKHPNDSLFKRLEKLQPSDEQYNSNVPTNAEVFINRPLYIAQNVVDGLKSGYAIIIYCGKVIYTNQATGKKRYLLFAVTLPSPQSGINPMSDRTFTEIVMKNGDA